MKSYLNNLGLKNQSSKEELLEFITPGGVLYLVMNRPEVHNAFDSEQMKNLTQALEKAKSNPKVRVVVLTGEGKSFCAGGDISYMKTMGQNTFEENKADGLALAQLMNSLYYHPKPTIAQVKGAVFGGGVGLVCCCDIAVGSSDIKLALSEVKIGVIASTISPYVIQAVGTKTAKRLMLTGETLTSEMALKHGFISEIAETNQLENAIEMLTQSLLKNGPEALQKTKALVFEVAQKEIDQKLMDFTADSIAQVRSSPEAKEGLSAFLEKRKPLWNNPSQKN
jgi:methylglutaconyl-CoA hydratase